MIHKLARHQERRSKEICFYFFHINTHPGEVRTEIVSEFFVEHDFPTRVQQNMRELMGESEATTVCEWVRLTPMTTVPPLRTTSPDMS